MKLILPKKASNVVKSWLQVAMMKKGRIFNPSVTACMGIPESLIAQPGALTAPPGGRPPLL